MKGEVGTDTPSDADALCFGSRAPSARRGVRNTPAGRWLILHSMLETVGSKGYDAATLGEVLGRAGVSTRAFDLEFDSKEDCFSAAFRGEIRRIEAWLADAVKSEETWPAKFRVGMKCLVDLVEAEPNVARALFTDTGTVRAFTNEGWSRILDRAAAAIDGARSAPDAESPPQIAAKAVVAKIYTLLRSRIQSSRPVEDITPDLVFHAIRPYFGAEVAQREMLVVTNPVPPATRNLSRRRRSGTSPTPSV